MKPDVAIVIVTYNSEDEIEACLESVLAERETVTQRIVVVDNDSKDGTVALVRERFPQVDLVLPGENLGFAAGVNLGVEKSDSEYVLLLNPDTKIVRHGIDRVVGFARENPRHGIYGGRTLTPDGKLEPSCCWGAPTLWSMFLFAFGITTLAPRNRFLDPESLGSWQRDSVREVGVVTGCFLLASRAVWDELGGLDTRYFMYGEDVDFSMRAREAGYSPVICPRAELVHEVGKSSDTPVHKTLLLYRGKASLIRTRWHGPSRSLALLFLATGTGLRALLSGFRSGSGDRWRTLWKKRREWLRGYENRIPARPVKSAESSLIPNH